MEAPISFKWWPPPSSASLPLVLLITIQAGQILKHLPTSLSIETLLDISLLQNHDPPCGRAGLALQSLLLLCTLNTSALILSFSCRCLVLSSSHRLSHLLSSRLPLILLTSSHPLNILSSSRHPPILSTSSYPLNILSSSQLPLILSTSSCPIFLL
jgi:hypothetical protein